MFASPIFYWALAGVGFGILLLIQGLNLEPRIALIVNTIMLVPGVLLMGAAYADAIKLFQLEGGSAQLVLHVVAGTILMLHCVISVIGVNIRHHPHSGHGEPQPAVGAASSLALGGAR